MSKFLIIMAILSTWSCGLGNMCDNKVIEEVYSQDRQLKAIIFERDCGATTGTSNQLSIIKAGEELGNESGNVFVVDQGDIRIEWANPKQLHVYYDSLANTFEMKERIEGIVIKYKGA